MAALAPSGSLDDRVETVELTLYGNMRAKQLGLVDTVQTHELEINEWRFYKRFARTVFTLLGVTSVSSVLILIITVYNFLRSVGAIP